MRIIFSAKYEVDLGSHVFSTRKFKGVVESLIRSGEIAAKDVAEPSPASRKELILVHTDEWVSKILDGKTTPWDEAMLELPYSPDLAAAHHTAVGGTILACREALQTGLGLHVGGGFHHAFAGHGEGFCVFNDMAVAIVLLQREKKIRKALVVDLDVHQGNGTASLFAQDSSVFTFSMHQQNLYPVFKPPSSLDVNLPEGTGDGEYLFILRRELPKILDRHRPELVLFQAGADPYEKDLLGGLKITLKGFEHRDETVFSECFRRKIPVAVTLGGGYAANLQDTVFIHAQTCRVGMKQHRVFWGQNG
ncbi:MAG: histone deacetylase [Elusimicrobia bacterium]|nr:histone deacetylase [Elusimicrobiota bacterium]